MLIRNTKYWSVYVLGLLVLVGCASASTPTPSAIAQPDTAAAIQRLAAGAPPSPFDMQRHGAPLQLVQTMKGITVTLNLVGMDHNRVLLNYSVYGAADRIYDARDINLTSTTGERFPGGMLMSAGGSSDMLKGTVPPNYLVGLADFETIAGTGPGSHVRVTLNTEEYIPLPSPPPPSLLDRLHSVFQQPQDTQAIAQPAVPGPTTGPFVFEFTLPNP